MHGTSLYIMNYARYGSYYLQSMKSIDILYPGLKKILENNCLSVQSQDNVTMLGEQTSNRDAKTMGSIRGFASDESSVKKWTMNRSEQAINRVIENVWHGQFIRNV